MFYAFWLIRYAFLFISSLFVIASRNRFSKFVLFAYPFISPLSLSLERKIENELFWWFDLIVKFVSTTFWPPCRLNTRRELMKLVPSVIKCGIITLCEHIVKSDFLMIFLRYCSCLSASPQFREMFKCYAMIVIHISIWLTLCNRAHE